MSVVQTTHQVIFLSALAVIAFAKEKNIAMNALSMDDVLIWT